MPYLRADQGRSFSEGFNRRSFTFDHSLHESPLWELPRLVEVSKRLAHSYHATGDAGIDAGWRAGESSQPASLPEALAGIADSQSLVMLKGLAEDEEYAPIVRSVLGELEAAVGGVLRSDASLWRATVIVGAPHRITPYHIDAEANFLFQLRGEKSLNVFDQTDGSVLTDAELEAFYAGDASAARYKAETQAGALSVAFAAGRGAHIPLHAPHWVRNGPGVSVAVSVNCALRSGARLARLYRLNAAMRSRGLRPASPGASPWQDSVKLAALGGLRLARGGRA